MSIQLRVVKILSSLTVIFACSCAGRKIDPPLDYPTAVYTYRQAEFLNDRVRRVVVLAPENASISPEPIARDIQHAVSEAIREHGLYEVIELPYESSPATCKAWIQAGEYPVRLLSNMHVDYNADAVLFVSVNAVRAVSPVSVELSLRLVETDEAIMLCSIDGHWSMNDPAILRRAVAENAIGFANLDPQLISQSFRALLEIVGADVALELGGQQQVAACPVEEQTR